MKKKFWRLLFLILGCFSNQLHLTAVAPGQPMGTYYGSHFEFDEDVTLYQELMLQMTLDGSTSVLDLNYVDGTLYNDCLLNAFSYQGETPYSDAVIRSGGVANLLDPFIYFDLGVTFDWVVCTGLPGIFPSGNESVFVDNLKRHANTGIIITWFERNSNSPYFLNQRTEGEVEAFFVQQGLTRDIAMEVVLRANANPLNFWPQILYVFRP